MESTHRLPHYPPILRPSPTAVFMMMIMKNQSTGVRANRRMAVGRYRKQQIKKERWHQAWDSAPPTVVAMRKVHLARENLICERQEIELPYV